MTLVLKILEGHLEETQFHRRGNKTGKQPSFVPRDRRPHPSSHHSTATPQMYDSRSESKKPHVITMVSDGEEIDQDDHLVSYVMTILY